jgi:hypothetical protein
MQGASQTRLYATERSILGQFAGLRLIDKSLTSRYVVWIIARVAAISGMPTSFAFSNAVSADSPPTLTTSDFIAFQTRTLNLRSYGKATFPKSPVVHDRKS